MKLTKEEEIKELNHEEATMKEDLNNLMDMWSCSYAMKIMDEVMLTLEKTGLVDEQNKLGVKQVLYQFGNRIRDHTLDSNYVHLMRANYFWYLDNDRKRLEAKE